MQSLNVFEKGIGYLYACIGYYSDSCAHIMLYILALVFIMIKGSRRERDIFVPSGIFLLVTVYNPIAPVILDKFFDVNSEYYRFFWITPIVVLLPYIFTKLILEADTTKKRFILTVFSLLILILSGSFLYKDGIRLAENIYKMPSELMEISKLIHEDSKDEYPKAFLEYEYNMQMRQYDPKIMLTIDREDYIYAVSYPYTDEMLNDDAHPQYKLLASLIKQQPIEEEAVLDALETTKTEYIVLNKNNQKISFLKIAGLKKVADTANHTILKYSIKEPAPFELVDYSVVY